MHLANSACQPWRYAQEYCVIAVLRALQLHIDDEKARFQVFVRRPNPDLSGADFAWDRALAMCAIGGHTAVHRNSQPWNTGWKRSSWAD
eukprot:8226594-Pyramimonas_sp.AAC.1